jgi:hypothetical protein
VHHLEPKVGGTFKMSFRNFTTGKSHAFGGEYVELVPDERLRYTDKFDDPNLPGEMQVTVMLKKVSVGTELDIAQAGVPDVIHLRLVISAGRSRCETWRGSSSPRSINSASGSSKRPPRSDRVVDFRDSALAPSTRMSDLAQGSKRIVTIHRMADQMDDGVIEKARHWLGTEWMVAGSSLFVDSQFHRVANGHLNSSARMTPQGPGSRKGAARLKLWTTRVPAEPPFFIKNLTSLE